MDWNQIAAGLKGIVDGTLTDDTEAKAVLAAARKFIDDESFTNLDRKSLLFDAMDEFFRLPINAAS